MFIFERLCAGIFSGLLSFVAGGRFGAWLRDAAGDLAGAFRSVRVQRGRAVVEARRVFARELAARTGMSAGRRLALGGLARDGRRADARVRRLPGHGRRAGGQGDHAAETDAARAGHGRTARTRDRTASRGDGAQGAHAQGPDHDAGETENTPGTVEHDETETLPMQRTLLTRADLAATKQTD